MTPSSLRFKLSDVNPCGKKERRSPPLQVKRPGSNSSPEETPDSSSNNFQLNSSEQKFLSWLDSEIDKIDEFYRSKEEENRQRYDILKEQFQKMEVFKRSSDNAPGLPTGQSFPSSPDGKPLHYANVKRQLRYTTLEWHRQMELLQQYRLLNRTGINKILKKFDKTTGRRKREEYKKKLKSIYFVQSDELSDIIEHTEVYICPFSIAKN